MKNFILFLFLVLVSSLSLQTRAGVLLEPYLGVSINGDGDSNVNGNAFEHEFSGLTYGARLGVTKLGFMLGLDYSLSRYGLESTSVASAFDDRIKRNQLGVFFGYELPIFFRVWGTYFVDASTEGDDAFSNPASQFIGSNSEFEDGSGYALGASYTALPFLMLNIEYRVIEFDSVTSTSINAVAEPFDTKEILLTVSLPFNL